MGRVEHQVAPVDFHGRFHHSECFHPLQVERPHSVVLGDGERLRHDDGTDNGTKQEEVKGRKKKKKEEEEEEDTCTLPSSQPHSDWFKNMFTPYTP